MNIVGLGNAGCNIAGRFKDLGPYRVTTIDSERREGNHIEIPVQLRPEGYEENPPQISLPEGETMLIVAGAGYISGMSLTILQQIQNHKLDVMFIVSDNEILSEKRKMQERVTFNVFQEYARSGLLRNVYLISNSSVEKVLDNVPIVGYYDRINDAIVSAFHMVKVFEHEKPIMGQLEVPHDTARIVSYGIYNIEENEEMLFFSLDNVRDSCYILGITENNLNTDGTLRRTIVDNLRAKALDYSSNVSFGIYPIDYEANYTYVKMYSSDIQIYTTEGETNNGD
jgi:hypothetical protein